MLVNSEMNADLCMPITDDEIKVAVFDLGALKAPGLDGFPGKFYQNFWETINDEVCGTTKDFSTVGFNLSALNRTHIAFIPKVQNPENVSQFRPISLCNNSYKIISKVLANHLRKILPTIISDIQNAFVPGRAIQDNLLVAHEVFHYLKTKRKGSVNDLGLKLDMNKVNDKVEWDFLEATMSQMGFCNQ